MNADYQKLTQVGNSNDTNHRIRSFICDHILSNEFRYSNFASQTIRVSFSTPGDLKNRVVVFAVHVLQKSCQQRVVLNKNYTVSKFHCLTLLSFLTQ